MRFYDVDSGEILLDGVNIKDYNLHDLRKALSLVMQEPIIFNYSILENILYGKLDALNSEVEHAVNVSNCAEFVNSGVTEIDDQAKSLKEQLEKYKDEIISLMGKDKYDESAEIINRIIQQEENRGVFTTNQGDVDTRGEELIDTKLGNGYQTNCGIRGGKLSGGQKQRVAIARTIIRQPKVLILDEATSALDETNQKMVQEALDSAMKGKTTIVIAHRMSTIQNCNKIFVLEDGKVKEEGAFDELNKPGGYFANK
jgi:ABC-type multidrug transport system fused ATPase/permease subunit